VVFVSRDLGAALAYEPDIHPIMEDGKPWSRVGHSQSIKER